MYRTDEFEWYTLRVLPNGRIIWLRCLKETAKFYGWDKAFPTVIATKNEASGGMGFRDPGRRGLKTSAGKLHYICRSPKTQGTPKGMTNRFGVSSNATTQDLALIAEKTQVDWYWMTAKYGERRSREKWLQATPT